MNRALRFVPALLLLTTLAPACSDDETMSPSSSGGMTPSPGSGGTTADKDIVDTAIGAGTFGTLVSAVQAADLESTLRGTGPFTVFAPTDAAFGKLPAFITEKLVTAPYKGELGLILKYHVLSGDVKAADILGKELQPDTVSGAKLSINGADNKVVVNGTSQVQTADIAAKNGRIHVVDTVLLPTIADTAIHYDDGTTTFKTLVAALTAGELAATLAGPGPFTVFAPTDAAFAKIPQATLDGILADKPKLQRLLKYHVISGNPVYANAVTAGNVTTLSGDVAITTDNGVELSAVGGAKAKVILTDLPASNGVTHVIDTVIVPSDL